MQVGATSVAPPELWEAILFPPHPLLATLSHSALGSSLQVRAQESVIEDGRRGEPSAVVLQDITDRQ